MASHSSYGRQHQEVYLDRALGFFVLMLMIAGWLGRGTRAAELVVNMPS